MEGKAVYLAFSVPWFLPPSELTDADGQSPEQSWLAAGLYPHAEECVD
jgi:hypothetical protein